VLSYEGASVQIHYMIMHDANACWVIVFMLYVSGTAQVAQYLALITLSTHIWAITVVRTTPTSCTSRTKRLISCSY